MVCELNESMHPLPDSSNYRHRVHERDLHENDEDLQKYGRKYCDVSATEPELIKSILGKVVLCPGYALNEILKDELGHMVHISTKSDPGNDEIFQNAEYSYLINFPTKKLLVHTKKEVSVHTRKEKDLWVNVPLLNDTDWNVLSEFGIFDKNKASRTLGLVERGPEWMVRFDKEPLVKRLR